MRIVIKVGTSILTDKNSGLLNKKYILCLAKTISELQKDNHEILIVSSGAVIAGRAHTDVNIKSKTLKYKQAFAAIGQPLIISTYSNAFVKYGKMVAQILLTRDVFNERVKYLNARNTLNTLIKNNIVPIINENDSVSIDELNFGDNDTLAALVAVTINADKLVIFTDVDGFYYGNLARSSIIHKIEKITEEIEKFASESSSSGKGTGGMKTKISAAKIAGASGVDTIIMNGLKLSLLKNIIMDNYHEGTIIKAQKQFLEAKKSWIAYSKKTKGTIYVDKKASEILLNKGKSLLAVGIIKVQGNFQRGDTVNIACTDTKKDFARGLTNYDNVTLEKIKGKKSTDIKNFMNIIEDEVIHRNKLVLI
ncbi:MAG: glutamate 5-kinase [Endomicrobium sp.]|jgi:glutamate 5-kinase|nr:glutamate 5-kinase [Endomicrobium sp.]